ncbi:phosphomannomutase [Sphingomonas sp. Leaf412]|uniref:phosphoglucomutase/phosphomannomutase PgmG n=1 Tax=Sphingomonas sp. Leaf412 TaxID=1736370 RepID=UPI0006FE5A4A|nr:phosphomannomutase/phosphoglucomutase [Sphingomonas sp. Leaf412]KQT31932.1 phosphomannomutase [Sphingomonas sp. Leaf412]
MSHHFAPDILRAYDIRGTVGRTLHAADAHAVGRSFATRIRRAGGRRVAVGYDGRTHSPMLEAALVAGLAAGGVDVVRIGLCPSPMLYYAAHTLEVDGGIQVTGSHNPKQDNGFKLVLHRASFFGDDIRDLAAIAAAGDWSVGDGIVTDADVGDDYVGRVMAGYAGGAFRIGWDAGNGAAGPALQKLVERLPGEHHLLFADVDGEFPNHHPDPTIEANLTDLKRLVADKRLDFGVAFDGDGDRIGLVDGLGRVLWGDEILAILAQPLLARFPGAAIVADVKSSQAVFDRIETLGGRVVMGRTGHSHMKALMQETGAPIGGELSGHIFFGDGWYGFDDALYAAVRLIQTVHVSGTTLAELRDQLPPRCATPEWRVPVAEGEKQAAVAALVDRLRGEGAAIDLTDGVRVTTPDGWWLLRASNTEAALTLRAEARDAEGLARVTDHLAAHGFVAPG